MYCFRTDMVLNLKKPLENRETIQIIYKHL